LQALLAGLTQPGNSRRGMITGVRPDPRAQADS